MSIILIENKSKDNRNKKTKSISIFLMNIDKKILSKMLANCIQYIMTKGILSQECNAGLAFKNQCNLQLSD